MREKRTMKKKKKTFRMRRKKFNRSETVDR